MRRDKEGRPRAIELIRPCARAFERGPAQRADGSVKRSHRRRRRRRRARGIHIYSTFFSVRDDLYADVAREVCERVLIRASRERDHRPLGFSRVR